MRVKVWFVVFAGLLPCQLLAAANGEKLVPFTNAELSKHVGEKITVKGLWNSRSKQPCELTNRESSCGVYIHGVLPAKPAQSKSDSMSKQRFSELQHGDCVIATGFLYHYVEQNVNRDNSVTVQRMPDHYYFDGSAVKVTKSEWAKYDTLPN